jgi:ATP-dependent DNA ligase
MGRLQAKGERGIERHRSRHPAVCYLFDCLYLDGRPIVNDPLRRRREWLADALKRGSSYRLSEVVEDGTALFDAARQAELEGIVAKDPKSPYLPGRRSDHWLKIKVRQTTDCLIIGFTKGKGDRKKEFGALHLAQSNGEGLTYLGKVGTGFDSRTLKSISALLATVEVGDRPVKVKPVDDLQTVWLTPQLYCEVQYASVTRNGTLREPVFMRLRPDLEA